MLVQKAPEAKTAKTCVHMDRGTDDVDADVARLEALRMAERHRVTVLHYDHEYDLIASVTGQQVRWIVPRGTADRP